jgi:hypothetical protein
MLRFAHCDSEPAASETVGSWRKRKRRSPRKVEKVATLGSQFPCPCCGYLTLPEEPPGTFFICPVGRWDDDNLQFDNVNLRGGANRVSLKQAQANFGRLAKSDPDRRGEVRSPLPHER